MESMSGERLSRRPGEFHVLRRIPTYPISLARLPRIAMPSCVLNLPGDLNWVFPFALPGSRLRRLIDTATGQSGFLSCVGMYLILVPNSFRTNPVRT